MVTSVCLDPLGAAAPAATPSAPESGETASCIAPGVASAAALTGGVIAGGTACLSSALMPPSTRRIGELRLADRHHIDGQRPGIVEILPDGAYVLERSGEICERGRIEVRGEQLVLVPETGPARSFARRDEGRQVRLVSEASGEVLQVSGRSENTLESVVRLVRQTKALRWIFQGNYGVVASRDGEPWLLRNRKPTPDFIVWLQEYHGVKTILSLNGHLDERAYQTLPFGGGVVEVNLRDFIGTRGLRHAIFEQGAGRAPSDDELVDIFSVIMNPDNWPIAMNCRGGADRTGVIAALFAIEFQGKSKDEALAIMREHGWQGDEKTWVQGAYVLAYRPGRLTELLEENGVVIPEDLRRR